MQTIDTVYEAWQQAQWDKVDPEEIEEAYVLFRQAIRNVDDSLQSKIWDAMTLCQMRAAKIAFKAGYRMGYKLRDEIEEGKL